MTDSQIIARRAILLAGGQSTRMGTDKAMLMLEGRPLLVRLAEQLADLGFTSIIVAAGSRERGERYKDALLGSHAASFTSMVVDHVPDCGPLSGLHAGLAALPSGYVFVMACDMPAVSASLLNRMLAAREEASAGSDQPDVIRTSDQPFHAFYHTRIADQLERSLQAGERRVMQLINRLSTCYIELEDGEESAFTNLNTPEAFVQFRTGRAE